MTEGDHATHADVRGLQFDGQSAANLRSAAFATLTPIAFTALGWEVSSIDDTVEAFA